MKSKAFGLDIGTTSIKAVWLNHEKNTFVYNTSFDVVMPPQGMQSESPFDQQEMAQYINKVVIDSKITTNKVNIALPENHVFTKVIDLPAISEKELSSAIYWEAEQYIPAPLDTMTLDYTILRRPKDSLSEQRMQVLLVAAAKQLVKRYQTILELAGLTLVAVETEILSVMRGIVGGNRIPTSLLMNIGALNTLLSIVQNNTIVFSYSIPLGGTSLTRSIAADFGVATNQAEEYKRVYGLSDKNFGGKVGQAIEPILSTILVEVKKALTFYNDKYKNESSVSQIILTGGGASLPGIDMYFAKNIGTETVTANPWKMLNIQEVPSEVESHGPEYTTAIGLALKEYE